MMTIFGKPRARAGQILFDGRDITEVPTHEIARLRIAQSPEGRRIFPRMSVAENLQMGADATDGSEADRAAGLERVFTLFPRLKERMAQRGGTLSGGEQQMLAIGRALMSRPRLLMLDEPSLGLAPLIARQIFDAIRTLNRQDGLTVLIVEQNANHALRLAHRGYVMVNGLITLSGTGAELLQRPEIRAAYLEGGRRASDSTIRPDASTAVLAAKLPMTSRQNQPTMAAISEPGAAPGTSRSDHPRGSLMKSLKLIGLALGASLALSTAALAQDITIAVAGPMTGGESAFGRQMKNGAEQAVADLNAAGGVLGKKLALDVEDDACDPKQARSVAEKIASAKIPFVAGHYCSSSSIPASEAYADGNVLQITPASTNPLFTERKLWNVARVCGRDDQQGPVAGDYIAKNFKGKNIAILNDKTTYGKGLADETKKALNKAGVTEKMFESYNKGDKDFNAIVSRLKRDNIDLVYVGGYHQEAGLILRQMRDQGLKTILMAGDALADKEFASITGPAGEGTLFTFGPDPRNKPTAKAIVEKFKAKNIDPEGYTLYTYAAIQVWSRRRQEGRHHRSEEGDGRDQGRLLGYRDRQAGVRRQGRHQADSTMSSTNGTPRAATPRSIRRAREPSTLASAPGSPRRFRCDRWCHLPHLSQDGDEQSADRYRGRPRRSCRRCRPGVGRHRGDFR